MKIPFFYTVFLSLLCSSSFGMETGRDESPMRVDTPRCSTSRERSPSTEIIMKESEDSALLDLKAFSEQLAEADRKFDFSKVNTLYKEFLDFDQEGTFWEEEANKLGALRWGVQSWKTVVGAHIFFNVAINKPHMSLIATALQKLEETGPSHWEEVYAATRQKVSEIIKTHPYFRRRTGLYALGAAYSFGHRVAQLLFVEAMAQLETDENKQDLERAGPIVNLNLKNSQSGLRDFLALTPDRIEDLRGEDLKDPDKLREYADFGLPHYRILWARSLREQIRNSQLSKEERFVKYGELHSVYWQAGDEGDYEGYYSLTTLKGVGLEHIQKLAYDSFKQGNNRAFKIINKNRNNLIKDLDIYLNLKKFLLPTRCV